MLIIANGKEHILCRSHLILMSKTEIILVNNSFFDKFSTNRR